MPGDTTLKPQWFQILLALAGGPLHGTAIMEEVLERTDGEMRLWPATLYGSLRDLESEGWIDEAPAPEDAPTEGGRRKFYVLAPEGREVLAAETRRLAQWVAVARDRAVLDEAGSA